MSRQWTFSVGRTINAKVPHFFYHAPPFDSLRSLMVYDQEDKIIESDALSEALKMPNRMGKKFVY